MKPFVRPPMFGAVVSSVVISATPACTGDDGRPHATFASSPASGSVDTTEGSSSTADATGGEVASGEAMTTSGPGATGSDATGSDATGSMTTNTQGTTTASETEGATPPWRPFSPTSPWNTPLAENPPLAPNSDQLISLLIQSTPTKFFYTNIEAFSIPVHWVDGAVPMVDVIVQRVAGTGFHDDPRAPIPPYATPDPASDQHMLLVDKATDRSWDFFGASKDGGDWVCKVCSTSDLSGDGVRPLHDSPQWWQAHGARACGFPLIAGLITEEELLAGRIDHALVIAYPGIRPRYYTRPASTAQATFGSLDPNVGIPCGGRIQLDPDLDLDSLALSDSAKVIARALQEYGAFVGDFAGAAVIYADGSPAAQDTWSSGVLDNLEIQSIPLQAFRVLAFGTLYDNGN